MVVLSDFVYISKISPITLDLYRPAYTEFRAAYIFCCVHTQQGRTGIWVDLNDVIQYPLCLGRACVQTQAFWRGLNGFASNVT